MFAFVFFLLISGPFTGSFHSRIFTVNVQVMKKSFNKNPRYLALFSMAVLAVLSCKKDDGLDGQFTITYEISDISNNAVTYDIIPSDENTSYYSNIRPTSYFEGKSEIDVIKKDIEALMEEHGIVTIENMAYGRQNHVSHFNLYRNTEYTIYSFAVDHDGNTDYRLFRKDIKTDGENMVELEFTADVKILDVNAAEISIVPSDEESSWYWTYVTDEDIRKADGNLEKVLADEIAASVESEMSNGISFDEALHSIAHFGSFSNTISTLFGSTEYTMLMCAIDNKGNAVSEISTHEFETMKVPVSENRFSVSFSNITPISVDVAIATGNDDPYTFFLTYTDELEDVEQVVDYYIKDNGIIMNTGLYDIYRNDFTTSFNNLYPGTGYTLIIFGYQGGRTTAINTYEFSTI